MKVSVFFRNTTLTILICASTYVYAQAHTEKIKAKWSIQKFEIEKNTPRAIKAQQDLQGVNLTFDTKDLVISKKTASGDSVIKKGQYFISGNSLILGKDEAEILSLSETHLKIKIPGQGVLYLTKL